MENYNAVKNSIVPGTKLSKDDVRTKVDATMFKQVVGNLMYLVTSWTYLMYGVSLVNIFIYSPTESHCFPTKQILSYSKGTTKLDIYYKKNRNTNLVAYTYNDFVGTLNDRRNAYGFMFLLGFGVVSWSLKK